MRPYLFTRARLRARWALSRCCVCGRRIGLRREFVLFAGPTPAHYPGEFCRWRLGGRGEPDVIKGELPEDLTRAQRRKLGLPPVARTVSVGPVRRVRVS